MSLGSLRLGSAAPALGEGLPPARSHLLAAAEPTDRGRWSCLSVPTAQRALPPSLLPPSLFQPPQPHIFHSFTPGRVSGISGLPYPLHWYPRMQVGQVNITNQRNTLNRERQETYSRNRSESKTNCHTNSESAVNLTALLRVPGVTPLPSWEQCSLTCLVPQWGITYKNSFFGENAVSLCAEPCCYCAMVYTTQVLER